MEKLMLFPYTRRSRCDVPSCKEFADYQIGVKMNRPMVTLCKEHTMNLYGAMSSEMMKVIKAEKAEARKEAEITEPVVETEEPVAEEVVAEAPKKRGRKPKKDNSDAVSDNK